MTFQRSETGSFGIRLSIFVSLFFLFNASAAEDEKVSLWDWSVRLNAGGGHKDNVLLSDFNQESSAFTFTEGEIFIFRLPVDEWEFTSLITAEDRRYWQSTTADKEQLVLGTVEVKRKFLERWKAGLNLQYFYNDQVFDASVLEGSTNAFRILSRVHRFSGGPSLQVDLPQKRRLELNLNITRQNFEVPLDDSWEWGPKLLFGKKYGVSSDATAMFQFRERTYDRRPVAASPLDKSLGFSIPEFELGLKHYWDPQKHWRSRARLGVELNDDNGTGEFDYRRWRVSKEVSFTKGGFEATMQGKFLRYEYARQTTLDGDARRRTELLFNGRIKQEIAKHVSLFAEAEYEWVMARDFTERYRAATIWAGIEWEPK